MHLIAKLSSAAHMVFLSPGVSGCLPDAASAIPNGQQCHIRGEKRYIYIYIVNKTRTKNTPNKIRTDCCGSVVERQPRNQEVMVQFPVRAGTQVVWPILVRGHATGS